MSWLELRMGGIGTGPHVNRIRATFSAGLPAWGEDAAGAAAKGCAHEVPHVHT